MEGTKTIEIVKDLPAKKIKVTRYFNAPVDKVWQAWTQPGLLDQWWAPKPYKAFTKNMDLRPGGQWLYYMESPEGERHWCKVAYSAINAGKSFEGDDMFCDENGNPNTAFPNMHWAVSFTPDGDATKVVIDISFDSEADLQKIVEMGFEQGFTMALGNLDEMFAK